MPQGGASASLWEVGELEFFLLENGKGCQVFLSHADQLL